MQDSCPVTNELIDFGICGMFPLFYLILSGERSPVFPPALMLLQ